MLICSSTDFISLMVSTSSPKLDVSLLSESPSVLSSLSVNSSLSLLGTGTSDLKYSKCGCPVVNWSILCSQQCNVHGV